LNCKKREGQETIKILPITITILYLYLYHHLLLLLFLWLNRKVSY